MAIRRMSDRDVTEVRSRYDACPIAISARPQAITASVKSSSRRWSTMPDYTNIPNTETSEASNVNG